MYETAKETLMYRSLMDSVREGEGGKIWENGIETCKISCMKWVASPGSMHDILFLKKILIIWKLGDSRTVTLCQASTCVKNIFT